MSDLTPQQQAMVGLWEKHLEYEFERKDENLAVSTMVEDASVNHVPTMAGGKGREDLRQFYGHHFVNQIPPDMEMTPVSRTVGDESIVDEMIVEFTHTGEVDWMLPGIAPTGKTIKIAVVVIVHFRDGHLAHENIYWDQASVLAQIGLLPPEELPISGAEAADKVRAG